MNRIKFWKITAPIMGLAAVGSIGGAVGYYFYKTAPEKWNNSLQEFREVRLGFDGNQMIGYLASGQYNGADHKEKLLTWEERETSKVVYVTNETTKVTKKFLLDAQHEEDSIIYTLPGKQGDKFKIAVESKGIRFRNEEIRKNAFDNAPNETDATKLRATLKTIKDKSEGNALMDYDDEDIKAYTKNAAAEFRLDYMSGDVSLGGVDGKVDTPTTSYIQSLNYDDVIKGIKDIKALKSEVNIGNAAPIKYLNVYADKKVTLHADVASLGAGMDFGQFKERKIDYTILQAAVKAAPKLATNAALTTDEKAALAYTSSIVMIPRVMADVSPDTQLLDKKVSVEVKGKTYELGKLERYNNEFVVSDLSGIYKDAAAKTADAGHYGDLKITSWW